MRALLVEDDLTASRGIVAMLKSAAMIVDAVDTGEEALELARLYDYDVVILDLVLPDMEGYEVVRRLRAARVETPILILSGLARPQAKVKGFGMGADDFITKPFDREELIARIQAVVRRTKGFAQQNLAVGPLVLNLGSRDVTVAGTSVHLTGKEYAILELLTLRKGVVMTKEAFLNHLYGGMDEPEVKIIDVFICKLRKKLAQAGADNLIATVWGPRLRAAGADDRRHAPVRRRAGDRAAGRPRGLTGTAGAPPGRRPPSAPPPILRAGRRAPGGRRGTGRQARDRGYRRAPRRTRACRAARPRHAGPEPSARPRHDKPSRNQNLCGPTRKSLKQRN
jgi:two-component system, cell cycle response regulator CtrA